jgi:hypothetical protein
MHRTRPAPLPTFRPESPRPSSGAMEILCTAVAGLTPGLLPIEALIDRIEGRA